jgi:hypothetical protein
MSECKESMSHLEKSGSWSTMVYLLVNNYVKNLVFVLILENRSVSCNSILSSESLVNFNVALVDWGNGGKSNSCVSKHSSSFSRSKSSSSACEDTC